MLVILEAISGPIAGRQIQVKPGTILRVGRTVKSDYAIPGDSFLSSVHFAIECEDGQCKVRDMGSSNGTFLNGVKVDEALMKDSDTVAAGGSTFCVRFEVPPAVVPNLNATQAISAVTARVSPPPNLRQTVGITVPSPGDFANGERWAGFTQPQLALLSTLYRDPAESVFALLDASRESRIPAFLEASRERYLPVAGNLPSHTRNMAFPYVVQLPERSRLLDIFVKDGWGHGWGIYLTSRAPIETVCAHLANYLILKNGMGRDFCLRFFEPAVLHAILPTCSAAECVDFFGPSTRFIVESGKGETALCLSVNAHGLQQERITLA